tara:strand:- start:3120 stop:3620 length:501 start_codon:yes stop_codon:yes gene_type:complete
LEQGELIRMQDTNYLQDQVNQAETNRDNFVAGMGTDYTRGNLDRLQALQAQVTETTARLREVTNAAQTSVVTITTGNAVPSAEMCVVTLIRNGKSDRCLEVRSDATLGEIVIALNQEEGGWDISNLTFKRRVGPGQTADIVDPRNTKLGEGPHEIWVGNKVAGGSQ